MGRSRSSQNALRDLKGRLSDLRARHEERHRPTGFGFVFADRIDYLDGAQWDAVTDHATVFLRRDVLRVIEDHGPDNVVPRYAMIFRGRTPVAALAVQIVSVTGDRLHRVAEVAKAAPKGGLVRRMLAPAARKAGGKFRERMLVVGNLLSSGFHGVAFADDGDAATVWPGVAEAIYRIRRAEKLSGQADVVMVKDVTAAQAGTEALRRFSYRAAETEPNMVLHLDPAWQTYDDYLAALDSKNRKKVKAWEKKLGAAGCTVERCTDLTPHVPRLHELYLAVQRNAAVRLVTLREGYLAALAGVVGDEFRCTMVRRGADVIGFVTTLRDGDTAVGYFIGFDRAAAGEGLPVYLRLLHATIADAIDWRCTTLSLGRTALEPKAGMGALPEPMAVWVRHRLPAINWVLRGLLNAVPHDEAPERHPFKKKDAGGEAE